LADHRCSHNLSNELRKFKQNGGELARRKAFLLTCPCDARCGLHRLHEQRRERERRKGMPSVLVLHIYPVTREPRHLPMRLPVKQKVQARGNDIIIFPPVVGLSQASLSWQMAVSQKNTARKRRRFRTPRSASAPLCRRAVHRLRGTRTVFLRGVFPSLSWQTIRPEPVLATHVLEPQASIVLDLVVPCKRILPSASSTAARLRSALNPLMCLSSGTEIRVEIEASAVAIRGAITCAKKHPACFR
jgi:hypothetical protein